MPSVEALSTITTCSEEQAFARATRALTTPETMSFRFHVTTTATTLADRVWIMGTTGRSE